MLKGKYIVFTILLLLVGCSCSFAQRSKVVIDQEYKLKAAYIYKFTKYIEWTYKLSEVDTFYIGVLGESEILPILNRVAKRKKIKDRPIVVHHYKRIEDFNTRLGLPKISSHILFISKYVEIEDAEKLSQFSKRNILLIGETEDFARKQGGLINFVIKRNKLKFEINQNDMINCGFKINPKLLRLAILVNNDDESYTQEEDNERVPKNK